MATYQIIDASLGDRRSFVITAGLRVGYGETATTYSVDVAIQATLNWMKQRASQEQPFLTGMVTSGDVVYAWPEGPGKAGGGHEPTILFSGEVSPLYGGNLSDSEVISMLTDLAAELGNALGQTRVYIAYCDKVWIIQAEETETPTGESV
jgi:hypothetical protein